MYNYRDKSEIINSFELSLFLNCVYKFVKIKVIVCHDEILINFVTN